MTEKILTDLILKLLIDERDLVSLSYDRLNALAERIGHAIAHSRPLVGHQYAANLERADELFIEADHLSDIGEHGAALRLLLTAEDLSLESTEAIHDQQ